MQVSFNGLISPFDTAFKLLPSFMPCNALLNAAIGQSAAVLSLQSRRNNGEKPIAPAQSDECMLCSSRLLTVSHSRRGSLALPFTPSLAEPPGNSDLKRLISMMKAIIIDLTLNPHSVIEKHVQEVNYLRHYSI